MSVDPWKLLELAVASIPAIASQLRTDLANGEFDEDTADKVRQILPAKSESGELADRLRALHED